MKQGFFKKMKVIVNQVDECGLQVNEKNSKVICIK